MTNTINMTAIESTKSAALKKTNADTDGLQVTPTEDIADSENSFSASMLKLSDEANGVEENLSTLVSGNILPVAGSVEEKAEDSSPLLLESSQEFEDDAIETSMLSAVAFETPALIEKSIKLGAEGNVITSSVRSLLPADNKSSALKSTAAINNSVNSSDTISGLTVDSANQAPEMSALQVENVDLMKQKVPGVNVPTGQNANSLSMQPQFSVADNQSALLQQFSNSHQTADSGILVSPLNTTPNTTPLASTSSLSIPTELDVAEPFGRPAWAQGMSKQIIWMANQNISSAELRLNPAHLGPIEVRIDISDDQINIALSSRHAMVREAMETALPRLRDMFDSNGMNLANADISHQSFSQQREQNLSNGHLVPESASVISSDFSTSDEVVIQQTQLSSAMVDYYI